MDIKNVSFSGNTRIEKLLCNNNMSKPSQEFIDQDVKVVVCFKQRLDSKLARPTCLNSVFQIHKQDCIKNIFDALSRIFTQFSPIKIRSKFDHQISISFRMMNTDEYNFQSEFFTINGQTAGSMRNVLTISMGGDATFNATLVYTIICDKNYYGSNCQNFCKAMDKESGHYNCTETGQWICLPGWKGIFCSEAHCENCFNGQCSGPGNCKCYGGWTGANCEICLKAPGCIHGMCQNDSGVFNSTKPVLKAFTCACNPGWGGQNCDIDLKHCINHMGLCQNNGICHNYYGNYLKRYLCQCAPGYSGRHCQIKTGDCNHDKNSLNNFQSKNPAPSCRCYPGFSGSHCQINKTLQIQIDSIKSYLRSDGYCVNSKEGYSCSCSDLYGGLCRCRFIKCLNNETCIDNQRPYINCSGHDKSRSVFEFSSNFRLVNSSFIFKFDTTTEGIQESPKIFDFKYYFGSLIFVPLLLGILIVVAVKFRYKFRRKSRASIKTIHNDLGIVNNQIKNPIILTEQCFLLNQKSLPTSFSTGNCINNLLAIQETMNNQNKSGDVILSNKKIDEEFIKSDLSNSITESSVKNPVICNPNLLINNYKDFNETKM